MARHETGTQWCVIGEELFRLSSGGGVYVDNFHPTVVDRYIQGDNGVPQMSYYSRVEAEMLVYISDAFRLGPR